VSQEGYFGERVAARYDADSGGMFDPEVVGPAVEMLAGLAGDGAALEFAIGTGRIALPLGQTVLPWRADPEGMSYYVYDTVTQRLSGQHYRFGEGGLRPSPIEMRYAWPAELDLMARLAGMRLQGRYGGWRREPFTGLSPAHVSLYEKL
jgi:hypothetical protein